MHVDAPCPACDKLGLDFGDVMENVISCPSCSYRHAEVIILVGSEEDMLVRVVRSGSARIEIPELGIKSGRSACDD